MVDAPGIPVGPAAGALDAAAAVDPDRLWRRHMAMARHGATAAGGVNRQALSPEDVAARRELRGWAREIGLQPSIDDIGNLFLRLPGADADAAPVLAGSHMDSQPTGGRFDGIYGVLAALEAVEAMRETGTTPRRPIDVVAWTNEEGSRFAPGMMGSSVFAGRRDLAAMLRVRDADGVSVADALAGLMAAESELPKRQGTTAPAAYLEAHIEQGPILEAKGVPVGVVTGIQGKLTLRVTVTGERGHAGTVPQDERKDALAAAVALISAMQDAIADGGPDVKFTVGRFDTTPNAPSVIPSGVDFSIDLRHPDDGVLQDLGDRIADICRPERAGCDVRLDELSNDQALEFPEALRALVGASADGLQIASMPILSAAGHDARHLHYMCPTAMIFVPCRAGVSHREDEHADADHLADGARTLTAALATLADAG